MLAMGLAGCGGLPSGGAAESGQEQETAPEAPEESSEPVDAKDEHIAAGYLDKYGIITAKALIELYTEDYIAADERGIASHFNRNDYLLEDARTIDEIWPILQAGEVS